MAFFSRYLPQRLGSLSPVVLYCASITFITVWWCAGFLPIWSKKTCIKPIADISNEHFDLPHFPISHIDKSSLHRALTGDIQTMLDLITQWEIDTRILEKKAPFRINRFSEESFLKAQIIGRRLLSHGETSCLHAKRLMPQTYLSASLLLALTETTHIVALPEGFRVNNAFFDSSILDQIPIDINAYSSEIIYHLQPEIAFVAHYSHPATLQTLARQKISLVAMNEIHTIPEITTTIKQLGQIIERPLKAQLLAFFIESAMVAIDHRLLSVYHQVVAEKPLPQLLFLEYGPHYYLPTAETLSGQLIQRLQAINLPVITLPNPDKQWRIPMDQEKIRRLNPDCLIISCFEKQGLTEKIACDLSFVKSNSIYCVDAAAQVPNQFLVLAYYECAKAVANAISQTRNHSRETVNEYRCAQENRNGETKHLHAALVDGSKTPTEKINPSEQF